jgi:hypothetical protein
VFKPEDEEPLAPNNPRGRAAPAPPPPAGGWALAPAGGPPGSSAAAAAGGEAALAAGAPLCAAAPGEGLRRGLRPGEGAAREVAAYVLDHGRFSGVPATAMVALELGAGAEGFADDADGLLSAAAGPHVKVGSLQEWVPSESDCEERGVSEFPDSEVHKIAVGGRLVFWGGQ